jgi:tetratricopeptide (TPR) repeat protein
MERFLLALVLCSWLAPLQQKQQQPPPANSGAGKGTISLQDKTWALILDLSGFTVKISETKDDGRRYLYAANDSTGVGVSATLEEVGPGQSREGCQDVFQGRLKDQALKRTELRTWTTADRDFQFFMIPEAQGMPVQQGNLFVCMFRDDTFVDIHFSKVQFKPDDLKLFDQILATMRFDDNIPRSSLDYFVVGSLYYMRQEYKRAIPRYAQALAMEQKHAELEKKFWYVLVDNLGMAYGMTGDLEKAKGTFEYGLSKDATYPLFYYNMACYYGEKGDAENAGAYLKKAFANKRNTLPGETIPDPFQDDSFQKILRDPEFRKLVDSLVKGN